MIRHLYVLTFSLTGLVCLLGLALAFALDHPDTRWSLGGLLTFSSGWSLLTALQLVTASHTFARAIHVAALITGLATVFTWLAFASAYAGRQYHRRRSLQVGGMALFVVIILVKLTNPFHGLYFSTSMATEPFVHMTVDYHAPHWFVTGFSYTAVAVGFLWLFDSFTAHAADSPEKSSPIRLYVLVFVTALPIVPYALSSFAERLVQINYEPLGVAVFTLGVLFYARSEFAQHSSPGQSTLADRLSDGGLVLDESGIVIDHNEQAARILGEPTIPRAPLAEVDSDLAGLDTGERKRLSYEVGGHKRTYEAKRAAATDSLIAAEVVTLKDVTRVTRLEQLMAMHQEISEALMNETDPWTFIEQVPQQFAAIDAYAFAWLYPVPGNGDTTESPGGVGEHSQRFTAESGAIPGTVAGGATAYAEWAGSSAAPTEPVLAAARSQQPQQVAVDAATGEWSRRLATQGITDCLAVPISFSENQTGVLGIYTTDPGGFDGTERQLIEEVCRRIPETIETIETHQQALRYQEALTHAGTAIVITDTDGTIEYVNPAFEQLTGYSPDEVIGSTPSILSSGEMSNEYYDELWGTITEGDVFRDRIINKTKDGDRYIAQETISPVTDDVGEPGAYVAIQFEITDRLLREQRLAVLNRVLRHNLRTAVNVIDAHATLLEDRVSDRLPEGELPEQIRDSIEKIRFHAEQLTERSETAREIEQILSSDQSEKLHVPVETVATAAETTAESLGGRCTVELDEDLTDLQVDAELRQIAEELVENAVVHSGREPEDVDVHISLARDGDEVVVTVADDGPGISEQELVALEDGAEEPLRHGSGLDLWKVHWLTVSLGGSIAATTGEDGTTIHVTVPLRGNTGST